MNVTSKRAIAEFNALLGASVDSIPPALVEAWDKTKNILYNDADHSASGASMAGPAIVGGLLGFAIGRGKK